MKPSDVNEMIRELKRVIYGQDEMIESVVAAVCCGGNALIIGPPSCGKTRLTKAILSACTEKTFYLQMSVATRPEMIIGDIDIKEFKENGRIIHKKDRMLVSVLAGLDEFLLIPPETQKTINEILEDRKFENEDTPVRAVICLSNPGDVDPSVMDRFTCVIKTKGIIEDGKSDSILKLIKAVDSSFSPTSTFLKDFSDTIKAVNSIEISSNAHMVLADIIKGIRSDNTLPMYDRTIKHCLALMRLSAWSNNNAEVGVTDINHLHFAFVNKTSLTRENIGAVISVAKEISETRMAIFRRKKQDALDHYAKVQDLARSLSPNNPLRSDIIALNTQINELPDSDNVFNKLTAKLKELDGVSEKRKRDKILGEIKTMMKLEVSSDTRNQYMLELVSTGTSVIEIDGVRWRLQLDQVNRKFVFEPIISSRASDADKLISAYSSLKVKIIG